MKQMRYRLMVCASVVAVAMSLSSFRLRAADAKAVFVIAMENHNWTQPANQFTGGIQQIYQNPNAPYINSLVDGTSAHQRSGRVRRGVSQRVGDSERREPSYSSLGTQLHLGGSRHKFRRAQRSRSVCGAGGTNQDTTLHLSALLTQAGRTWRSYQEDTDLARNGGGQLVNLPLAPGLWTVPLVSINGVFASGFNEFNLSTQYNYAAKHNPMVFFTDSNGGNDATPANPLSKQYAPLQQLPLDLASGNLADYIWITPNQYNDMHTTLSAGFQGLTGDLRENQAGRLLPEPDRADDHGIGRVQEPWRDRLMVGRSGIRWCGRRQR